MAFINRGALVDAHAIKDDIIIDNRAFKHEVFVKHHSLSTAHRAASSAPIIAIEGGIVAVLAVITLRLHVIELAGINRMAKFRNAVVTIDLVSVIEVIGIVIEDPGGSEWNVMALEFAITVFLDGVILNAEFRIGGEALTKIGRRPRGVVITLATISLRTRT